VHIVEHKIAINNKVLYMTAQQHILRSHYDAVAGKPQSGFSY